MRAIAHCGQKSASATVTPAASSTSGTGYCRLSRATARRRGDRIEIDFGVVQSPQWHLQWPSVMRADFVAKVGRLDHWAYHYGQLPDALTLILVAPKEHTERLTVARPAMQVVAGSGRWQQEQTHHRHPAGPRSRSRLSLSMRFKCANCISIFQVVFTDEPTVRGSCGCSLSCSATAG